MTFKQGEINDKVIHLISLPIRPIVWYNMILFCLEIPMVSVGDLQISWGWKIIVHNQKTSQLKPDRSLVKKVPNYRMTPTIALSCPSQQARCIMASAMNRACKLPMLSRAAGGLVVIFTEACPAHLLLYQWKAWVAEWFDLWFRRSIPLRFTLAEENQMWKGSKRSLQCMLNLLNSEPREWSNWRKQTLRSMWVRSLKQNALMHFGRVW